MTRRRIIVLLVIVSVLTIGGLAARQLSGSPNVIAEGTGLVIPTSRVTRGSLQLTVHMQGDLRASKQMALTAPSVGGTLRVLNVLETGTAVAKDDEIMTFDPADQQYALEQAESELLEAEQEIIKRRADVKAQEAQDAVAVLTAQFDVRRATLDAAVDADLIPSNEYSIRQAELREAKRQLAKVEEDVKSRSITSKASLAVLEERRTKTRLAADRARQNMENLVIRAPMDGVVSVRENMDASGGFFFGGMSLPAYRAGDSVFSGRPVIDVFDVSSMEIRARVNEQERANVSAGQTARIESDALPGVALTAKVSSVAGLGRADSRMGPLRLFDVALELAQPDPRLRPGTSVRVLVIGDVVDNLLLVPRQALFEIDGKPTVYVRPGGSQTFEPRQVKVLHRTESQVAVEGLDEAAEVALIDPVAALKAGATVAATGPGGGK